MDTGAVAEDMASAVAKGDWPVKPSIWLSDDEGAALESGNGMAGIFGREAV